MQASDLYGLPLDRFVAERGARAKELRREGHREEAASIAALRKPSVAAWAVNQLVRTQRRAVTALFAAGDALQSAQSELLDGRGDAAALREAAERERAALEKLLAAARGLLSSEGHEMTAATLERVSDTLHAAALDDDARARMRDGCLDRELRHVGLGAGPAPAPRAKARPAPRPKAGTDPRPQARAQQQQQSQRRRAARQAEADARRAAERAERALRTAQERRDRAAELLRETQDALAAAYERASAAAEAHRRAQLALKRRY
jgi:hypothetical protein